LGIRPASEMVMSQSSITLSVFMEGTSNPMDIITTQIAMFSRICTATSLRDDLQGEVTEKFKAGHYRLCFAGCGVTNGFSGVVFAHGLRDQCAVVRKYVDAFLQQGHTIKLNFLGLSRGGIGGAYLAQELKDLSSEKIILNLLLFDPVPGNFIWMARRLDMGGLMNTNQAMDLSEIQNLGRVLVLYPYEPLPAIAVHAPLIFRFPQKCDLEIDVILGCHQGALFLEPKTDTCLSFSRIHAFMTECGTPFNTAVKYAQDLIRTPQVLEQALARELQRNAPSSRDTHAPESRIDIVRHPEGQFLNRYHKELLRQLGRTSSPAGKPDAPEFMLDFNPPLQDRDGSSSHVRSCF